ncbi:pleiotropic drug resistance protein 1-like isoform X2 [Silene latifolia]|uniref:pleiotropic drug resistance protein 1-like isoform X2 n=1 Tax=Silene latifolia TaxID=37657 RepID=UPI003D770AD0
MESFQVENTEKNMEDKHALKWGVLQRLPTYKLVRKSLLFKDGNEPIQVDVNRLGLQEKKDVVDRLVKVIAEDNEQFLFKLRDRLDRVAIDIPTVEVRFEDLSIDGEAYVGTRALPSIYNSVLNLLEDVLHYLHLLNSRKVPISILHGVSGIIKPGRMVLLLGPPGSGKTTLLQALAGHLNKGLKISGNITYNGHEMDDFVAQRTSAYVSQHDSHIGEMTVRETLAFSARCQGVGTNYDMLVELIRREKENKVIPDADIDTYMKAAALEGQEISIVTDYILKILEMDSCADMLVGNAMIRGISGGERKRLTTGEILVGPAKALFMDDISSGLDTSTTFQIVNCIRQYIHILKGTAVLSLLQPAPETFNLFDDIILLSDGQIVYQGPRESVIEFFEFMGFRCPERKGVADFLQEVTSLKEQEKYWVKEDPYVFVTAKDFTDTFRSFHVGQKLEHDLSEPYDKVRSHPASLARQTYGVNKKELLQACVSREFLLMKRNVFIYLFKMTELGITALITSTLFFRTKMPKETVADGGIFMGALFFSIIRMIYNGFSEVSLTVNQLPVFYKQRNLRLYPAWAYTLPKWILKLPLSIAEVAIWVCITYYITGFDPAIGKFFKHYLALLCVHQTAAGLYRLIAGLARDMILANTLGQCVVMVYIVLGGFALARGDVKKWWLWGYWTSPIMYGQNAIAVNEFTGNSWKKVDPNSSETLGLEVLKERGLFAGANWYWLGIAAMVGFWLLFNSLFTLSLTCLNPIGKPHTIPLAENKVEENSSDKEERQAQTPSVMLSQPTKQEEDKRKQVVVLPFEPLSISFEEISYSVDIPQAMKGEGVANDKLHLVNGVTGVFRPGVLTALMGVTGAGKTTLMDVLAGRKTTGYVHGGVYISGYPKRQETFARISGYVEQTDIHSPHVTVYEALLFSAWLRLSTDVDSVTRKLFINEVMELVELTTLRNALVGLPGVNGLSTEQRKRLTIAVELVANPSIIFMDEPTSGLDARAAAIVMKTVKNTVNTGRTVVCTIHQPSIDIFDTFDELLLLKRGGEAIYFGPLGHHGCHLISYFEEIDGVAKMNDGYNPATWMLEVSSGAQEAKLGINFADIYRRSELCRRMKTLVEELTDPVPGTQELHFSTQYSQSFFSQCMACLWKRHCSYWRNPRHNAVRLLLSILLGLTFGSIYWQLGSKRKRAQDLFNAMGSMYGAVFVLGVCNASSVQPVIAVERTVFYRERAAGMYSAVPYAISQTIIELPYCFLQAIIYGTIVYATMGFEWRVDKFFWFIFFMYSTLLYFTYYGMMVMSLSRNQTVAAILSSASYTLWNLFSGFVVPKTRIPIWWRWYYWICPVSWTLNGLIVSQFGEIRDKLDTGETVEEFIRHYFGFRSDLLGGVAAVVIGFALVFSLTFAYSIRTFNFQVK